MAPRTASRLRRILGFGLLALPLAALAHTGPYAGAHHGFMDGFTHPFTGLDHLAAMVAVGVWSALVFHGDTRKLLLAPLSFAGMLLVGALVGLAGVAMPGVEPMIAASLLVIGLLVATQAKLPAALAGGVVGLFALFHGAAHGYELAGEGAWSPILGMLIGTAMLHAAGIVAGLGLRRQTVWLPRLAGASVAVFGASLLPGMA